MVLSEVTKPIVGTEFEDSSTLAKIGHMISENDFSHVPELISKRLEYLEAISTRVSIGRYQKEIHRGYIHSGSEIRMGSFIKEFKPDDPELYQAGFEQLARLSKMHPEANAIILAIGSLPFFMYAYFGNIASPQNKREIIAAGNMELAGIYGDEKANSSIRRFKNKKNSVCIHHASAAQEFLSLCGLDTTLVLGKIVYEDRDDNPYEGHAFNVLQIKDQAFVLDAYNPRLKKNKDQNIIYFVGTAIYPISIEQKDHILGGGSVQVEHTDQYLENGYLSLAKSNRTYGWPIE